MITTVELVKHEANMLSLSDDLLIQPHLITAELELKSILSEEMYNEIAGKGRENFEFNLLQKAETNLAISFLLFSLSLKYENGIIFRKEENLQIMEVMSEYQIKILSEHYYEIGKRFTESLIKNHYNNHFISSQLILISVSGRD